MEQRRTLTAVAVLAAATLVTLTAGCSQEAPTVTQDPAPPPTTSEADADAATAADGGAAVLADDIPVATTPPGGWTEWPEPVLSACTEPLVAGAPDLRGLWRVVAVEVDGAPAPDHRAMGLVQRVEQCGDRLVVTAGGIVHDMRADGTEENGVHDVAEADKTTPITVVASYEDGVHVLRPVGVPVEVRRWREGEQMVWRYLDFTAVSDRIGEPDDAPPAT